MADSWEKNCIWVVELVEDLHSQIGRARIWEKLPQWIDFGTCCLILSCSLWEIQLTYDYCRGMMNIDK